MAVSIVLIQNSLECGARIFENVVVHDHVTSIHSISYVVSRAGGNGLKQMRSHSTAREDSDAVQTNPMENWQFSLLRGVKTTRPNVVSFAPQCLDRASAVE